MKILCLLSLILFATTSLASQSGGGANRPLVGRIAQSSIFFHGHVVEGSWSENRVFYRIKVDRVFVGKVGSDVLVSVDPGEAAAWEVKLAVGADYFFLFGGTASGDKFLCCNENQGNTFGYYRLRHSWYNGDPAPSIVVYENAVPSSFPEDLPLTEFKSSCKKSRSAHCKEVVFYNYVPIDVFRKYVVDRMKK